MAAQFDFAKTFKALTGHDPLLWQSRLHYAWFAQGRIPATCTLPTGLGKTSVIPIWLIALADSASRDGGRAILPRRLVYIVNRRTVVDQATNDAKRLLGRIYGYGKSAGLQQCPWATDEAIAAHGLSDEAALSDENAPIVAELRRKLADLSGDDPAAPLAVSTLRGELADNGEWKLNPARPAIIIGTIDMIGSKLLFSGYGDGRYGRAHHAGLIGQDTLIVHDEAHLSPTFGALLRSVEAEQRGCDESKPIRVMELSATSRAKAGGNETSGQRFGIEAEDLEGNVVQDRLNAVKRLAFKNAEKGKLVETIVGEATRMGANPRRVLVYVRSPEAARDIAGKIKKKLGTGSDERVRLLTGTIRGFERDELARSPLFREFRSNPSRTPLPNAVYLVATSAGEVGADLDADDLVCDLTTLDSMAQRFGRVNRLGGKDARTGTDRQAEITVVCEKAKNDDERKEKKNPKEPSKLDAAISKTSEILRRVAETGGDVRPAALAEVLKRNDAKDAFSPTPTVLPATDILFDSWALTSIMGKMPGRSEVGPYLHGIADEEARTTIAWRAELDLFAAATDLRKALRSIFAKHRIRPHETLSTNSYRVVDFFKAITKKRPALRETRVALIFPLNLEVLTIGEIVDSPSPLYAEPVLVLPATFGGLDSGGMLSADALPPEPPEPKPGESPPERPTLDIADQAGYEPLRDSPVGRLRVLITRANGRWTAEPLPGGNPKRLRAVFKKMHGFGDPIQYSVFKCDLSASERVMMLSALMDLIKVDDDRVIIARLGRTEEPAEERVEFLGKPLAPWERRRAVIV